MNYLFIDDPNTSDIQGTELNFTDANADKAVTLTATEQDTSGDPVANNETQTTTGGGGSFWIMMIIMIALMYFLMWRPESKRRKQMENFRKNLKKGDKIITAGGIYGTIKEVHETSLLIEVDSNVTLRIDKSMVAAAPVQNA